MKSKKVDRRIPFALLRRTTALGFLGLLVLGGRGLIGWLRGSTAATTVADSVPFTDPLAALEATLASGAFAPTAWIGAGLLAVLALLLGPVFCGWLCPLGLVLELTARLREASLKLLGIKRQNRPPRPLGARIFFLGLLLGIGFVGRVPVFQTLSPINILVRWLAFSSQIALSVLLVVVLLDLLVPRLWCRELCPQGALVALIGQHAPLRIRIDPERAGKLRCRRCEVACPMGIHVMENYTLAGRNSIDHPDCTRCGACIDTCPGGVLRLGFRKGQNSGTGTRGGKRGEKRVLEGEHGRDRRVG